MQKFRRTGDIGMSAEVKEARKKGIGGSDARIIMSGDQPAIEALWREKRGEQASEDLSEVLIVAMGNITEDLNTDWFELQSGMYVTDEQTRPVCAEWEIATSTLDGIVRAAIDGPKLGVFEAKFMLPFYWSQEKALEKYYPQVQHNMMVTGLERAWLSVITGGGQYVAIPVEGDYFYQQQLLQIEKDFWDCVLTGRTPGNPVIETPKIEAVRVVDMTGNNEWANWAGLINETYRDAVKHDDAKKAIKILMPDDAAVADGHGVKLKRSKDGKILFEIAEAVRVKEEDAELKRAAKAAEKEAAKAAKEAAKREKAGKRAA